MRVMKSKKGAELSMNIIIIAILAILVLVIVAGVFTGTFGKLMDILRGSSQDSLSTATSMCTNDCDVASSYETPQEKTNSKYCRETWKLDADADGKTDTDATGETRKYHCWDSPISVVCSSVKSFCAAE